MHKQARDYTTRALAARLPDLVAIIRIWVDASTTLRGKECLYAHDTDSCKLHAHDTGSCKQFRRTHYAIIQCHFAKYNRYARQLAHRCNCTCTLLMTLLMIKLWLSPLQSGSYKPSTCYAIYWCDAWILERRPMCGSMVDYLPAMQYAWDRFQLEPRHFCSSHPPLFFHLQAMQTLDFQQHRLFNTVH